MAPAPLPPRKMYIDLRPDEPAPDPESKSRPDVDAAIEADDGTQAPPPPRRSPRDTADEERPSLRTLRIFRVLMDD